MSRIQRALPWCFQERRKEHLHLAEGQQVQPAANLLAEKLASEWTGGVEGRKGACPTKKERRERSERSGERCCAGMFSQLPTLLWILRFKGLLFFLALKWRQKKRRGKCIHVAPN